jgi:uncharacterized membrane protein
MKWNSSGGERPYAVGLQTIRYALRVLPFVLVSLVLSGFSPFSNAMPHFTIQIPTSPISANDPSHITDINDSGSVIVNFYNKVYYGSWYSYVWQNGFTNKYDFDTSYGLKINNHNQVVGYGGSSDSSDGSFFNGTTTISLEELPGSQYWNRPYALNDAGQIYGYSLGDPNAPGGWERAVGWTSDGHVFELGIPPAGTYGNIATAVNNSNQVVGYRDGRNTIPNDIEQAWWWEGGSVHDLPALSGAIRPRSWAYSLNNSGEVVGAYFDDTALGTIGGAAKWVNDQLTILADPPSTKYSTAYDVNDGGFVVGLSDLVATPTAVATVWDPSGTPYLLSGLVDNLQGWKLEQALAINNLNQIVGIATDSKGNQHGFILTPVVPEPTATSLLGSMLGILALGVRRARALT